MRIVKSTSRWGDVSYCSSRVCILPQGSIFGSIVLLRDLCCSSTIHIAPHESIMHLNDPYCSSRIHTARLESVLLFNDPYCSSRIEHISSVLGFLKHGNGPVARSKFESLFRGGDAFVPGTTRRRKWSITGHDLCSRNTQYGDREFFSLRESSRCI